MNAAAALLAAVEIGHPLTRGSLALFPLFHERPPAGRYISGPRSEGHIEVAELDGGVVPVLEVGNESDYPILLLDGETPPDPGRSLGSCHGGWWWSSSTTSSDRGGGRTAQTSTSG